MMLVSSSGWAHSPITLIFTALSAVYGAAFAAGAALSATAATAASATPIRLKPLLLLVCLTHSNPSERDRTGQSETRYSRVPERVKCQPSRMNFATPAFEAGRNRPGSVH